VSTGRDALGEASCGRGDPGGGNTGRGDLAETSSGPGGLDEASFCTTRAGGADRPGESGGAQQTLGLGTREGALGPGPRRGGHGPGPRMRGELVPAEQATRVAESQPNSSEPGRGVGPRANLDAHGAGDGPGPTESRNEERALVEWRACAIGVGPDPGEPSRGGVLQPPRVHTRPALWPRRSAMRSDY